MDLPLDGASHPALLDDLLLDLASQLNLLPEFEWKYSTAILASKG